MENSSFKLRVVEEETDENGNWNLTFELDDATLRKLAEIGLRKILEDSMENEEYC